MPSLNIHDTNEIVRPDLTIFYVLDRSGSMAGKHDAILDVAMENTITELKKIRSIDSHLRIAVLEFDSMARWLAPAPQYIEDFMWRGIAQIKSTKQPGELSAPGGLTNIPEALKELNKQMSKRGFLNLEYGSYMPIIIFMTDGFINDQFMPQFQPTLDDLNNNLWFKRATKIGFAIGDEIERGADPEVVKQIVGKEGFTETRDLQAFADKLVKVSVTASLLNGTSRLTAPLQEDTASGEGGDSGWEKTSEDGWGPEGWGSTFNWDDYLCTYDSGFANGSSDWSPAKTVDVKNAWDGSSGSWDMTQAGF